MGRSPRAELVQLQKRLFRRNKAQIEASVAIDEPGFVAYERCYRRAVARYRRGASYATMLKAVVRADIVFVGDYHTCHQSQRSFLRILKTLQQDQSRPTMLCLELLHKRHQPSINQFIRRRMGEGRFVERVRLQDHWVFDLWDNFKPLFAFAQYHKLPVYGIDAAPRKADLAARDCATGQYLARLAHEFPDHRLMVLIGDLHLAPQHLPRETQQALTTRGCERRLCTLYQNSDQIYWQLAAKGREHQVEVVEVAKDQYCRMHTPPIICQQSYLNWLDHESGEIDYADAKQQFLQLAAQIAEYLRIPLGHEMDNVTVYTCGDLSFLDELKRRKSFSSQELRVIRRHVMAAESYCVPSERIVYLANLSVNHAAEEASHYLKFLCAGPEFPRPMVDAFYANILHEALGFFGSKVINPKRKCCHDDDFRRLRNYFQRHGVTKDRQLEYDTAQLLLEYRIAEHRGTPLECEQIFHQSADHFFALTHALGYILGETMFYGVMSRKLRRTVVRQLFTEHWWYEGQAFELYWKLHKKLQAVKVPKGRA